MAGFDMSDEKAAERMAAFCDPSYVDQMVRQAIRFCWMTLPKDRRNVDEVERQISRMVDRAFRDLREDREQFGQNAT